MVPLVRFRDLGRWGTLAAVAIVIFFTHIGIARAHTTGLSWVATSTPYVIDIGYDPIEFQVGLSARFDFQLHSEKTGDLSPYDHVWVRLEKDGTTFLATGIREQQIGPTTLLYRLPEVGTYTIEASYRTADGSEVALAKFPFSVSASDNAFAVGQYLIEALILVIGAAGGFFISRWSARHT